MLTNEPSDSERVQPRFIEPMYAEAVRELPDGGLWTYEAKLDGYRCLAAKRSRGIVLWSRRGNGFTARFPEIARACEKLPPDTLIDGEVIAIDQDGHCSFNALQHSGPGTPTVLCVRHSDSSRAQRPAVAVGGKARATFSDDAIL
jgi:ATP-dependent DNA ligase